MTYDKNNESLKVIILTIINCMLWHTNYFLTKNRDYLVSNQIIKHPSLECVVEISIFLLKIGCEKVKNKKQFF